MLRALILVSVAVIAVQASDVLELTDKNFDDEIKKHDVVLAEFYAPWCGHCKKLAPEYEKAATRLRKTDSPVALAKIDCTAETETCKKFDVSGYPTLKIFKNGAFSKDYQGPREQDGIVKTMAKESGPSFKVLASDKELADFLAKDGGAVVGFFEDAEEDSIKTFKKLADVTEDLRLGYTTDAGVMKKQGYKNEVVYFRPQVMKNKFEDDSVKFTGDVKQQHKIQEFLLNNKHGLCPLRTGDNARDMKKPEFVVFFEVDYEKNPKGTNYWRNRVMKVAKKVKDEGLVAYFGISNKDEHSHEITECGISGDSDKPVACAYDERGRKFSMQHTFSVEAFEQFVRDVLDEKLEPYLKSEDIPEDNSDPVKVVVAKNFDELVNDPEKDVLIEFYAPWCGHCKSLAPKFDELAETLKEESEIAIVKMDATANDVPSPYDVRGFPTLFFAPRGSKSSPKKYEGGREVNDFIKYLAKEATNELNGWDRKGKKKGDKKKKKNIEL